MAKIRLPKPGILITSALVFLIISGAVFFYSYRLAQKTRSNTNPQFSEASRETQNNYQQVRKIRLIHQVTGEVTEIDIDGSVKQYDKFGKLIKSGRRGFAETQNIFKQYEWFVNNRQTIEGGNYLIEIETQKGVVVINPGGSGQGGDIVDDTEDFIDETINPTPTPVATPGSTPSPTSSPSPFIFPSPTPLPDKPDYLNAPPFNCDDYYTSGDKPLKISGIYCGIE